MRRKIITSLSVSLPPPLSLSLSLANVYYIDTLNTHTHTLSLSPPLTRKHLLSLLGASLSRNTWKRYKIQTQSLSLSLTFSRSLSILHTVESCAPKIGLCWERCTCWNKKSIITKLRCLRGVDVYFERQNLNQVSSKILPSSKRLIGKQLKLVYPCSFPEPVAAKVKFFSIEKSDFFLNRKR